MACLWPISIRQAREGVAMTTAIDAITAATLVQPPGGIVQQAGFALVLRSTQDPVMQAAEVQTALAPLPARVTPLSALEPRVLVAELPGRIFGADAAVAFAAGYALQEEFDLAAAEPDLPTGFFPEEPSPRAGKEPVPEGLEGFPPGCWAPEEPALDADPRWALRAMRVPEAWAFSQARQRPSRGEGVIVAQPDTGVTRHAELVGVASVPGFDVLSNDADPTDPLGVGNPGHGTATASVLVSPEALVVTGTAPRARHMPIRAIESVIRITQVSVARAIDWAVGHGAHVITMSLGGIPSFSLHRALRRAVDADVIVLAAAGNCVRTVVWPARYDECIAVAGTDVRDAVWRGSCRGPAVDVSAPGENVIRARVAQGGPDVGQGQGTSFAVALAAGVAALWLAHHGRANLIAAARARDETLQAMFLRLLHATARRPTVWDPFELGSGVVDAQALLAADLDLGRDRETVQMPSDPDARAAISVESLVAESFGPETVIDETLDWHRFGPEIATALLHMRLTAPPEEEGLRPEAPAEPALAPAVSEHLAEAVSNPRLRGRLGLDGESEPGVGREGAQP